MSQPNTTPYLMNIKIDLLANPVLVDRNTVRATMVCHGDPTVTFSRKMKGWTPNLEIVITDANGVSAVLHSCEAGKAEREAFDALAERAQTEADFNSDHARAVLRKAGSFLF